MFPVLVRKCCTNNSLHPSCSITAGCEAEVPIRSLCAFAGESSYAFGAGDVLRSLEKGALSVSSGEESFVSVPELDDFAHYFCSGCNCTIEASANSSVFTLRPLEDDCISYVIQAVEETEDLLRSGSTTLEIRGTEYDLSQVSLAPSNGRRLDAVQQEVVGSVANPISIDDPRCAYVSGLRWREIYAPPTDPSYAVDNTVLRQLLEGLEGDTTELTVDAALGMSLYGLNDMSYVTTPSGRYFKPVTTFCGYGDFPPCPSEGERHHGGPPCVGNDVMAQYIREAKCQQKSMLYSTGRCTDDGGEFGKCCTAFVHCGVMIHTSPHSSEYRFYASSLHEDATSKTQVVVYTHHATWAQGDNDGGLPLPRVTTYDQGSASIVPGAPVAVHAARNPKTGTLESCAPQSSTHCILHSGILARMEACPSDGTVVCDADDVYTWHLHRSGNQGCSFGTRGNFFSMACKDRNTGTATDDRPFCFEDVEYQSIVDRALCPSGAYDDASIVIQGDFSIDNTFRNQRQLEQRRLSKKGCSKLIAKFLGKLIAKATEVRQGRNAIVDTSTGLLQTAI